MSLCRCLGCCCSNSSGRTRFVTAHPAIEKIPNTFVLFKTFDHQFCSSGSGSSLDLDIRQPEPALNHSRAQMNIVEARIGQIDLRTKKQSSLHVNALVIKAISKRRESKIEVRQRKYYDRPVEQRQKKIIPPQSTFWSR